MEYASTKTEQKSHPQRPHFYIAVSLLEADRTLWARIIYWHAMFGRLGGEVMPSTKAKLMHHMLYYTKETSDSRNGRCGFKSKMDTESWSNSD